eukprot:2385463-Rhodomonas_salina.1
MAGVGLVLAKFDRDAERRGKVYVIKVRVGPTIGHSVGLNIGHSVGLTIGHGVGRTIGHVNSVGRTKGSRGGWGNVYVVTVLVRTYRRAYHRP